MIVLEKTRWLAFVIASALTPAVLSEEISQIQTCEDVLMVRPLNTFSSPLSETIFYNILELALEKSGRTYDLAPSRHMRRPKGEVYQMEELGDEANIVWATSSHPLHDEMLPIGPPFLRGLGSYKHLWVRTTDAESFANVRTIDDLKKFTLLTGRYWAGARILEKQGFNLLKAHVRNLPVMVMAGRGDALLWAITGSTAMYERYGARDLEMAPAPDLLARLPQAAYFYMPKDGSPDLYDAVASGLRAAYADGSLDELILSFPDIGDAYADLVTNDQVIIDIQNPDLSGEVMEQLETYGVKFGKQ